MHDVPLHCGLGLRRGLMTELLALEQSDVDFLECAPENWIGVGGVHGRQFAQLAERYPLVCHGLSLSLGGSLPLDRRLLEQTRVFLERYGVRHFSEHLSYCCDDGHLYDLLPIPFTDEAVRAVAARIRQAQDLLQRRIAVENISYYAAPYQAMSELDFILAVVAEADCDLLVDVNNITVNACNHGYDAQAFLRGLPIARVTGMHVAGHFDQASDLKIDSHGSAVSDNVWSLFALATARFGRRPTVLERDFNYPPLADLLQEVAHMRAIQREMAHE
ncbi:DUF692 domain-containing protein [Pseudomonas sp. NPDC089422]|uniref:HvfB family MNIO-type RiPP peptide maturase n=1 Tax=Pseudomonas sp. NPDC089422 TaxID=3364466 RepID=UPI0038118E57